MIKFIHTADVHFGMENYGKIDAQTGIHTRLLDFKRAFDACIDRAISEEVDFFLFAGDAYKTANPSPTQQRLLFNCLLRLYKAGIPIVIVIGNHDHPLSFGKANAVDIFSHLPIDGFHIISQPKTIQLITNNGPVNIVGIPWPSRNNIAITNKHLLKTASQITEYISKAVANIITQQADNLDPTIPAVLSGHLTVTTGVFSGSEKRAIYGTDPLFLPSQLAIPPFDYVGLGHLHRYQNLNPNGYPALVYSGSIERIDFGERKEDKGFCLVTIEKKGKTTHEFIKVPIRPFVQIVVKLDPDQAQTEQVLAAVKKHDLKGAIVKIVYHLAPGKKDRVDLQKVQRACISAMHLVGVIPVHTFSERERRTNMNVDMDLSTLLNAYFDTKPEWTKKKKLLIEKALKLQEELEHEN